MGSLYEAAKVMLAIGLAAWSITCLALVVSYLSGKVKGADLVPAAFGWLALWMIVCGPIAATFAVFAWATS